MGYTLKRVLVLAVALLMLAVTATAAAAQATPRIQLLVPPGSAAYDDLGKAIRHALGQLLPTLDVDIATPGEMVGSQPQQPGDLLIAIGDPVLPWALSAANRFRHTLYFYVSSTAHAAADPPAGDVSALYRDQPLLRQLTLARLLVPEAKRVAMLVNGAAVPPDFTEFARDASDAFSILDIATDPNWPRTLSRLMTTHEILLAQDDPAIYNRSTVRSLLLTTYRHGKVMVGPNRSFVEAGSLASVYSSSEQHLRQLTRMVKQFLDTGALPPPQFPTEFSVIINHQVAASLGIKVPGETTIAHQLHAVEKAR